MVGPGEVDDELEPEVKEECNGKYGDVISVIVFEVPNAPTPEESVRIFIEFKRVESAIKGKTFRIICICSMIILGPLNYNNSNQYVILFSCN